MSFESKDVITFLDAVERVGDLIQSGKSDSLIDYTRSTRVEPVTLVDQRITLLPYANDLLHSALDQFAGFYLQAAGIAVNVGRVNVIKLLDKLNPNRDVTASLGNGNWTGFSRSLEEGRLYFPGEEVNNSRSLEADAGASIPKSSEDYNLSVGKLLEVNIESDGHKASIPVQVRLRTMVIRPDLLVTAMTPGKQATSLKETWHLLRSGQKSFINDIILANDLITEHRSNLRNDKTGYYKSRMDAKRKNKIAGLISGNPSVANSSSIFIITEDTRLALESELRGKLNNFRDRQRLFEASAGMILMVVDPGYETVTIYYNGIVESSEVTIREIQRSKSGKGGDITDVMNALLKSKATSNF